MRKFLPALLLLLFPLAVFAFDYTNHTGQYTDAPFSTAESAGISYLTGKGVVRGNPDGTFAPGRTLNRAEFAQIAFLASGIKTFADPSANCFPDVHKADWFSAPVCFQKSQGAIGGNPDGLFHPERPVNYAEALKILGSIFHYQTAKQPADLWYTPFVRAAAEHKTLLPLSLGYDASLTRGQMARLTAAFMAEHDGDLAAYRAFERGQMLASSASSISSTSSVSSSASSTSSSSSISSSSASSLSSSSSLAQTAAPGFPAQSQFLVLGTTSLPIASATFFAAQEPVTIQGAQVNMKQKDDAIDAMFIVDANGRTIGQVTLDHLYDNTDKTWRGTFGMSGSGAFHIDKGTQQTIGIVVRLKPRNAGGGSDELVQVDTFKLTVQGDYSQASFTNAPNEFVFPQNQTAQGHITSAVNALSNSDALPVGASQLLAAFTIGGQAATGATIKVEHIDFQISAASSVHVSNWQLGGPDSSTRISCAVADNNIVSCIGIPDELGTLNGPRTFRLFGDVSVDSGATSPFLQVSLNQPGTVGQSGAIQWTDGSGHFVWTELQSPIARGTMWK